MKREEVDGKVKGGELYRKNHLCGSQDEICSLVENSKHNPFPFTSIFCWSLLCPKRTYISPGAHINYVQ